LSVYSAPQAESAEFAVCNLARHERLRLTAEQFNIFAYDPVVLDVYGRSSQSFLDHSKHPFLYRDY
jgi:hypothetical protein